MEFLHRYFRMVLPHCAKVKCARIPNDAYPEGEYGECEKVRPDFHYEYIDDAVYSSWLAECKPQASDFLASVGEPTSICDDGKFRTRAEIHVQGAAMVIANFWRDWGQVGFGKFSLVPPSLDEITQFSCMICRGK